MGASEALIATLFCLGVYMAFVAQAKARQFRRFMFAVATWRIVPTRFVRRFATAFIVFESVFSISLVLSALLSMSGMPYAGLVGGLLAGMVLALFAVAQVVITRLNAAAKCGCHGGTDQIGIGSIARASALSIVSVVAVTVAR